ncbi:glycosyltransferase [Pontibacter lucknowensis]|uniref:Glycosyltransferase involved in cell wall bisynthesis n=1 Tax=Pontibacter lucknowensis TaxID=1077936 RepID=A0A1N7AY93_9BACT|nr:glycosyltransferase [Pontibacter lucknowensis]SIR44127.1 Glycosyltransferase involved in cell wall bisynthesis [Pontibacter lucknowensis]
MKVLFVCSGNSKNFEVAPFIKAQGESLQKAGIEVAYFPIKGKGLRGYLQAGGQLRQHLKYHRYDLIHAHFSLSGWSAVLGAGSTPVILSLMGDDAQGDYIGVNKIRFSSRFFMLSSILIQPFVRAIISKAPNLEKYVYQKHKSYIVPNGIDTKTFIPNPAGYREELGLDPAKKLVLFLGSQERVGKNYPLAQQAVAHLNLPDVQLINPFPIPHDAIPKYMNSADVLVVPSFMEGSPNVIKEAMACNCPIVATDVGDIRWVMGDTEGCYLASFQVEDFAEKIHRALEFAQTKRRTTGRQRIERLGLDADTIAQKVISIYRKHVPIPAATVHEAAAQLTRNVTANTVSPTRSI